MRLLKDAEKSGAQGEKFKEEAEKRLAAFEKRFPVHEPTHKDPVLENEIKDAFGDLDDTLDKKDQIEEGKADIRARSQFFLLLLLFPSSIIRQAFDGEMTD